MFKKVNKEWLKDRWQTFSILIAIGAVIGVTPQTLRKAAVNTNQQIEKVMTFRATTHAALRGMMELEAVGKIELDGTLVNLELRQDVVSGARWVFVINGHIEMYEAVYSPIWRGYHYVDASSNYRFIKELVYVKPKEEEFNPSILLEQ